MTNYLHFFCIISKEKEKLLNIWIKLITEKRYEQITKLWVLVRKFCYNLMEPARHTDAAKLGINLLNIRENPRRQII